MTASNIGMLVNHGEIEHLLTSMSDSLRNAAYKVANQIAPKGSEKYDEFFDEVGTLKGYDEDTNKALLRDCLDHYVQFANAYGGTERTDFNYYLESNFLMVQQYVNQHPEVLAYLTSLFARACGILSSVLQPVMEDIYSRGQLIDKIESFITGPENTYYLVYGDNIDNPETYDPKEDDLSDVDCTQTPEELAQLEVRARARALTETIESYNKVPNSNDTVKRILDTVKNVTSQPFHPHIGSDEFVRLNQMDTSAVDSVLKQAIAETVQAHTTINPNTGERHIGINLAWQAPGTELL